MRVGGQVRKTTSQRNILVASICDKITGQRGTMKYALANYSSSPRLEIYSSVGSLSPVPPPLLLLLIIPCWDTRPDLLAQLLRQVVSFLSPGSLDL